MPPVGLCFTDDFLFSFFHCRPSHSTMGARISTRIVLSTASNSLARTVVKAPKPCHITPILRSLHWLRITERIECKVPSLTYKLLSLTTTQPPYLLNLISVQRLLGTRSSSVVTLAPLSSSSSLKITDRLFRYASPCLWDQLRLFFVNLILVPVPPFPAHLFLHTSGHRFSLFCFTTLHIHYSLSLSLLA